MKRIILAVAVLCFPISARSQVTTSLYKDMCQEYVHLQGTDKTNEDTGLCMGYTTGWMEGIDGTETTQKDKTYQVIFASHVKPSQVILVVMKYINEHPETLNKPISDTLIEALFEAKLMGLKPTEREIERREQ